MKSVIVLLVAALALSARAQIPSLGFCPEYLPMPGFEMERFAGIWYEAERYFQLSEVASRCVTSNYTKGPDGKYRVVNEITSRFTGIKRVLEGEIRKAPSKAEEGKLHVKYTTVPLIPLETQYNVLETDYDNYAVLWSCSGVGPVHTQNAWIMTRKRLAAGDILQKAYGVLDKYKISKVFFLKTNQDDCAYLDSLQEGENKPKATTTQAPLVLEPETDDSEEPQPIAGKSAAEVRPYITPDAPELIIKTRRAEIEAKEQNLIAKEAAAKQPIVEAADEPIVAAAAKLESVKSVPEVIMKIAAAEQAKEELAKEPVLEEKQAPIEAEQPLKKEEASIAEEPKEPAAAAAAAVVVLEEEKKPEPEQILEDKVQVVKA